MPATPFNKGEFVCRAHGFIGLILLVTLDCFVAVFGLRLRLPSVGAPRNDDMYYRTLR
jgi:hypothetical protein